MATASLLLQRDTSVSAVLEEQAAVDQALVEIARLVARVDDVVGARRLLEQAHLELAISAVVVGDGVGDALERLGALRVVHLEGAGVC